MKKILFLICVLLCLTGCGKPPEIAHVTETTVPPATEAVIETFAAETTQPVEEFPYEELSRCIFHFSSGAGGWRTELTIEADGSFSGRFEDYSAGISGEGYDTNVDRCLFTGVFTQAWKVNDYTYTLQLARLDYDRDPKEEIIDRVRYGNADPFGLTGGEEFLLYLPGAPLEELPQEYRSWVGYGELSWTEETALPFFGLYNVNQQNGFSSYDVLEKAQAMVEAAESQNTDLLQAIQEDPYATQADMNVNASTRYWIWDDVLNELWSLLKQTLDEESMRILTNEELAWINEKEAAVKEAGKDVEGGSLYPLVTGMKAADLTRERVYALLEYLQ